MGGPNIPSSLRLPWWPPVCLSLSPEGRSQVPEGGRVHTVTQMRKPRFKDIRKTANVT